jgi:hypothetical protein
MARSPSDSVKERPAEDEVKEPTTVKKDWTSYLSLGWDEQCTPRAIVTLKDWLREKQAWWQYRTPQKKRPDEPYMDMTEFVETRTARTFVRLLKANEYLPFALIGNNVPVRDKQNNVVKHKQTGEVVTKPSYSFARLRLQDLVMASYVLPEEQMRFCSISLTNRPIHLYLDLDCTAGKNEGFESIVGQLNEVLSLVLNSLDEYFESVQGREMNVSILQFGPACTATKFSAHVHIPSEVFLNLDHLRACIHGYIPYLKQHYSHTLLGKLNPDKFIDTSVYNSYSYLKMLGSRKPGRDNIQLYDLHTEKFTKLRDMTLAERFQALFYEMPSHALCAPKEQGFNEWPDVIEKQQKIAQRKIAGERVNADGLQESYFGFHTVDIQKAAEDNQFELVSELKSDPNFISFRTRNISFPRDCDVAGIDDAHETHLANLYVTQTAVYMMCAAERCRGHKKVLLRSPAASAKEAVLTDIIDTLDKSQVKSWDKTVKALIQAGATKEQLIEATEDTEGADIVETSWNYYSNLPELPRKPGPLLTLMKNQPHVEPAQVDVWKMKIQAAAAAAAAQRQVDEHRAPHDDLIASFNTTFEPLQNARKLPTKELMRWWKEHPGIGHDFVSRALIPFLNRFWVFVETEVKVYARACTGKKGYRWKAYSVEEFKHQLYASFVLPGLPANAKCDQGMVAKCWFEHPDKHEKDEATLVSPFALEEDQALEHQFNTWTDLLITHAEAVEKGNPDSDDAVLFEKWVKEGLLMLEISVDVKDYVWKWFASQYQRPGFRVLVALAFHSHIKQTGKSFLAKALVKYLLGTHIGDCAHQDNLFGQFNALLGNKAFLGCEEYEHKPEQISAIRNYLTNSTYHLRLMRENAEPRVSISNMMFSANNAEAYRLKELADRFIVLQVGLGIKHPDWCHLKGRAWNWHDIAARLLKVDLTGWDATKIPPTVGAQKQIVAAEVATDPLVTWWRAVLQNEHEPCFEFGSNVPNYFLYSSFCSHNKGNEQLFSQTAFMIKWRADCCPELAPVEIRKRKAGMDQGLWSRVSWNKGGKTLGVKLPPIETARETFEKHTNTTVIVQRIEADNTPAAELADV